MKTFGLLPSALIGAVASARSMTPMATIAMARLAGRGAPGRLILLDHPLFKFGALAMGAGELFGDKMKSAPDRVVPAGIAARLVTGAIAGAAVAPNTARARAAAVGAAAAVAASYITFNLRMRALRRYGQTKSGLVEDVITVGSTLLVMGASRRALAKPA
jgi:uncharacterized membrane protein